MCEYNVEFYFHKIGQVKCTGYREQMNYINTKRLRTTDLDIESYANTFTCKNKMNKIPV